MGKSKLKVLLAEIDITQKELANMTGLSRETINRIANGGRCTIDNAYKIVDVLEKFDSRLTFDKVFPNYYSYAARKKNRRKKSQY